MAKSWTLVITCASLNLIDRALAEKITGAHSFRKEIFTLTTMGGSIETIGSKLFT